MTRKNCLNDYEELLFFAYAFPINVVQDIVLYICIFHNLDRLKMLRMALFKVELFIIYHLMERY